MKSYNFKEMWEWTKYGQWKGKKGAFKKKDQNQLRIQDFLREVRIEEWVGGTNLLLGKMFAENCMKLKKMYWEEDVHPPRSATENVTFSKLP